MRSSEQSGKFEFSLKLICFPQGKVQKITRNSQLVSNKSKCNFQLTKFASPYIGRSIAGKLV